MLIQMLDLQSEKPKNRSGTSFLKLLGGNDQLIIKNPFLGFLQSDLTHTPLQQNLQKMILHLMFCSA
ncbi:hypothetical protein LINPERHAP2_LOCUS16426 [Linum perenne]